MQHGQLNKHTLGPMLSSSLTQSCMQSIVYRLGTVSLQQKKEKHQGTTRGLWGQDGAWKKEALFLSMFTHTLDLTQPPVYTQSSTSACVHRADLHRDLPVKWDAWESRGNYGEQAPAEFPSFRRLADSSKKNGKNWDVSYLLCCWTHFLMAKLQIHTNDNQLQSRRACWTKTCRFHID